jgi:hypothetical protein
MNEDQEGEKQPRLSQISAIDWNEIMGPDFKDLAGSQNQNEKIPLDFLLGGTLSLLRNTSGQNAANENQNSNPFAERNPFRIEGSQEQ